MGYGESAGAGIGASAGNGISSERPQPGTGLLSWLLSAWPARERLADI